MAEDDQRPISEIKVGDKVLACNEETGTTGYYPVEATLSHEDAAVERLVIDDEEIITTAEHPFFTREHGWLALSLSKCGGQRPATCFGVIW